ERRSVLHATIHPPGLHHDAPRKGAHDPRGASPRGGPMIHVENLAKSFRDLRRGLVHAVSDISFEAHPGEVFGLLGPNGVRKTTAMRILCPVLRPTGGTARIAGYDIVTQAAEVRRNIGFMSMNTAIYDRMSAWEMVEYFGRLYGLEGESLRARMEE